MLVAVRKRNTTTDTMFEMRLLYKQRTALLDLEFVESQVLNLERWHILLQRSERNINHETTCVHRH